MAGRSGIHEHGSFLDACRSCSNENAAVGRHEMKSGRIIIGLLASALITGGCVSVGQVRVLSFRDMPTLIEPHDVVAVAVCGLITDLATSAEGCVSKALKEAFPALRIISSSDFYRTVFPDAASDKSVRTWDDFSLLLKEPAFRERISPLGLRYLVLLEGGTQQQGEPSFGGEGAGLGAVTAFGWSGERQSSLWASILDLEKYQSAGHILAEASGKPWWSCVGLGPFCVPLGAAVFTESGACAKIGEGVVQFLKDEEVPAPLRIVLAPRLRPLTAKIGSGEKLSLKVFDKRKRDFLGYWRDLLDYSQHVGGSKIRNSNSFETVVDEALRTGLSGLGFEVLDSSVISSPNLEFIIDKFEYWLAYDAHVGAQVSVALNKGDQRTFDKIYTIENLFDKPSDYPDAKWIEEKINASTSDILSKILGDEDLLLRLKE